MTSPFTRESFPLTRKDIAAIRVKSNRAYYHAKQLRKENFSSQAFARCILDYYFWVAEDAEKIDLWAWGALESDRAEISEEEHKFLSDYLFRMKNSLDLRNFMRSYALLPGDVSTVDRKIFEKYAEHFERSLFPIPYED